MLTEAFPFLLPDNVGGELSARLRGLAYDLERIRAGVAPTAEELARAPLIVDWGTALSPLGLQLIGSVTGHPLLGDRAALTSQVWAADPDGQWVRTISRFYRLGLASRAQTTVGAGQAAQDFAGHL
jgi:hypothetical protein